MASLQYRQIGSCMISIYVSSIRKERTLLLIVEITFDHLNGERERERERLHYLLPKLGGKRIQETRNSRWSSSLKVYLYFVTLKILYLCFYKDVQTNTQNIFCHYDSHKTFAVIL